jgi:hypothetical protein
MGLRRVVTLAAVSVAASLPVAVTTSSAIASARCPFLVVRLDRGENTLRVGIQSGTSYATYGGLLTGVRQAYNLEPASQESYACLS